MPGPALRIMIDMNTRDTTPKGAPEKRPAVKSTQWALEDIDWSRFDASKVDPDLLAVAKAASLVEYNGYDYGTYLKGVFKDDRAFCRAAETWANEEVMHGKALARWCELADPEFDFEKSIADFRAGFRVDMEADASIRGSRAGELVARCIVETATTSLYSALADTTEEPVLKQVCQMIADDELRHYRLFHTYLARYLKKERIGTLGRWKIALGRIQESEDDELAYAYYAANGGRPEYDRAYFMSMAMETAFSKYRRRHVKMAVGMTLKAVGLREDGLLTGALTPVVQALLRRRLKAYRQIQRDLPAAA